MEGRNDDSDEESEIIEESPCGRWLKRREEVEQRNIPGIDATFLAMDTEEGVEVVWAEVILTNWDPKLSKAREEKIKQELDRLLQLDHPNIVKLHKYWTDISDDKARVIFITEFMSSGSLKQFLKKTKRNTIKMALPVSLNHACYVFYGIRFLSAMLNFFHLLLLHFQCHVLDIFCTILQKFIYSSRTPFNFVTSSIHFSAYFVSMTY